MTGLVVLAIAVALAVSIGSGWYWRRRQGTETHRMISLVGLLREPMFIDTAVLAKAASRAWGADLGDGVNEGADGFVVGIGPVHTMMYQQRPYLFNSVAGPYVDDAEEASKGFRDLRLRSLFRKHQAWMSCDALGIDRASRSEEIADAYRHIASLLAEFLDGNCLLIYAPDISRGFPVGDKTEPALRSQDPLAELEATLALPVIEISANNERVNAAAEMARERWPEFLRAFERRAGRHFAAKGPVSHGSATEFIWIMVTAVEGQRVFGTLENDPADLGALKYGSKVSIELPSLNDWCYVDPHGKLQGGFTIQAIQDAAREE